MLAAWVVSVMRVPAAEPGQFDLYKFGQLPVIYEGRTKPLDTVARNTLRSLSNKQDYRDTKGKKQPAIRWLLDLIAQPKVAFEQRVIRIDNPEVLNSLGLKERDEPADAECCQRPKGRVEGRRLCPAR